MNKTVLITGASSGIGMETAFKFASYNYNLILVARRKDRLEDIKHKIESKYDSKVMLISTDLSLIDSAGNLVAELKKSGAEVDILINNAGFGHTGNFLDSELKTDEEMMVLNMITLTKLSKLIALEMKKRRHGIIINIASTAAFQPVPNFAIYSATKAYVLSLSEAMAYELKTHNIRVITICPGPTESEFGKVAGFKMPSGIPNSADLASFIYNATKKNNSPAIHGIKNKIMVWSARFVPRNWIINIAAKMMK